MQGETANILVLLSAFIPLTYSDSKLRCTCTRCFLLVWGGFLLSASSDFLSVSIKIRSKWWPKDSIKSSVVWKPVSFRGIYEALIVPRVCRYRWFPALRHVSYISHRHHPIKKCTRLGINFTENAKKMKGIHSSTKSTPFICNLIQSFVTDFV